MQPLQAIVEDWFCSIEHPDFNREGPGFDPETSGPAGSQKHCFQLPLNESFKRAIGAQKRHFLILSDN
jgi:hypothetical protein